MTSDNRPISDKSLFSHLPLLTIQIIWNVEHQIARRTISWGLMVQILPLRVRRATETRLLNSLFLFWEQLNTNQLQYSSPSSSVLRTHFLARLPPQFFIFFYFFWWVSFDILLWCQIWLIFKNFNTSVLDIYG